MRALLATAWALALAGLSTLSPGVAGPIDVGVRDELLVEGHTVFLSIDAFQPVGPTLVPATPAPRVAGVDGGDEGGNVYERFPGVSWFNDQYLVAPGQSLSFEAPGPTRVESRYAAALAVHVRSDEGTHVRVPCGGAVLAVDAWDPDPRALPAKTEWRYLESYRLTDPNGRVSIVDLYRAGLFGYEFPVWVANLFGSPVFVPDVPARLVASAPDDCQGVDGLLATAAGATGDPTCGNADPVRLRMADRPCMSFLEPSLAGECYNGRAATDVDGDRRIRSADCRVPSQYPDRAYVALLYFPWDELRAAEAPRDHAEPRHALDTNGCESGTEWACPGETMWEVLPGADDHEGNSHPFHPHTPPHQERDPCLMPAPSAHNHGGSSAGASGLCGWDHATSRVHVYYSPAARPLEPGVRLFAIDDDAGSSDGFSASDDAHP